MANAAAPTPLLHRAFAAAPSLAVAASFVLAVLECLGDPRHRLTDAMSTMAAWPLYELLASAAGIALPAATALGDLVLPAASRRSRLRRTAVAALLVAPLLLVALTTGGGEGRLVVLFLVLAFAHWAAFESSSSWQALVGGVATSPVARSLFAFVKCYGIAVLAMVISGFVVVLPLDVFGDRLPDESRQHLLLVAVGAVYFVLLGAANLVDLDGRLARRAVREQQEREREAAWSRTPAEQRAPPGSPPPASARPGLADPTATPAVDLAHLESERWLDALELGARARRQIQYWDRATVRLGGRYRSKVFERRTMLALAALFLLGLAGAITAAAHPAAFENRRTQPRSSFSPPGTSEAESRQAFWALAGFAALLAAGTAARAHALRHATLGRARVLVDGTAGLLRRRGAGPLPIVTTELVAHEEPIGTWHLVARGSAEQAQLLVAVCRRDAELLAMALAPFGWKNGGAKGSSPAAAPAGGPATAVRATGHGRVSAPNKTIGWRRAGARSLPLPRRR